jgi:hypothetical protein
MLAGDVLNKVLICGLRMNNQQKRMNLGSEDQLCRYV